MCGLGWSGRAGASSGGMEAAAQGRCASGRWFSLLLGAGAAVDVVVVGGDPAPAV
jgi:hypothetical protein